MKPILTGIDHVHIYVDDQCKAEEWYQSTMGFERVDALMFWAVNNGEEFLAWKSQLENDGLDLRLADHKLAYSLYFRDPWDNLHEITTYERDYVARNRNPENSRLPHRSSK